MSVSVFFVLPFDFNSTVEPCYIDTGCNDSSGYNDTFSNSRPNPNSFVPNKTRMNWPDVTISEYNDKPHVTIPFSSPGGMYFPLVTIKSFKI